MTTLKEIVSEKVQEQIKLFVPPKNNCEKCAQCDEGRFCSQGCYYGSRPDLKGMTISAYEEESIKYFSIPEDKQREFKEFMNDLFYFYY